MIDFSIDNSQKKYQKTEEKRIQSFEKQFVRSSLESIVKMMGKHIIILMGQSSESNRVTMHKELIPQYQMLYCPYKIYRAAIQRSKLPSSRQISTKINKYLSIMGQVSFVTLFEAIGELQSEEEAEVIEARWSVMAAMTILIILLMKLGHKVGTIQDYENHYQQSEILLQVVKDGKKTAIQVEVKADRQIKKQSLSKIVYSFIRRQCEKYCLKLSQELSSSKLIVSSKNPLFLGNFEYPSILQVQGTGQPTCTLMLRPSNGQGYSLGFVEYFRLRDWVSQSRQFQQQYAVSELVKVYCQYFDKHIEQKSKNALYYCMITPEKIIVINQPKLELKINMEPFTIYVGTDSLMPKPFHTNIYSDRQRPVFLDRIDRWSLGLSLLYVISRYENQQLFDAQLAKAIDSQKIGQFVIDLVGRIESERQFDLHIVMSTLTKWLKLDYFTKKAYVPSANNLAVLSGTKKDYADKKSGESGVDWVMDMLANSKSLESLKPQIQNKQSTAKEPWLQQKLKPKNETQTLKLIKSIQSVITNPPANSLFNSTDNKMFKTFSTNSMLKPTLQGDSHKKPIIIHGKQIQIDIEGTSQKTTSQLWKLYESQLNDILNKVTEVQKKLSQCGTISLDAEKFNVIAMKLTEKIERQLGLELTKDVAQFKALGCHDSQSQETQEKCSMCVTKEKTQEINSSSSNQTVMVNHCGHGQCLKCWLKYIEPSAKKNKIEKISCFQPGCKKQLSYSILQQVMAQSKETQKAVYNKLAKIYSRAPETAVKHCIKNSCEQTTSLYQISQGNRLFYCSVCCCYICCKCTKNFHGAFPCNDFQAKSSQFQAHAKQQLAELLKVTKKKINMVSLKKLFRELKIPDQQSMIFQLEALLRACMVQVYAVREGPAVEGSKFKILFDLIPFLRDNLGSFYSAIQDLGSQTDKQIKQTAIKMRETMSNLLEIKRYMPALLFYACFK